MVTSVCSFYRAPADAAAPREDGFFANVLANLYGVADGASAAWSPSNPPFRYPRGLTGGQMVVQKLCVAGATADSLVGPDSFLRQVNENVLFEHQRQDFDPSVDDVGSAFLALAHVESDLVSLVLAGDCGAFAKRKGAWQFFTGFDYLAWGIEEQGKEAYRQLLVQAGGNKGRAWDKYYPSYRNKRRTWYNKQMERGGCAALNGHLAFERCATYRYVKSAGLETIVLVTDGLVPSQLARPDLHEELAQQFGAQYEKGGFKDVVAWRDATETSLPHIDGWPEATGLALQLS